MPIMIVFAIAAAALMIPVMVSWMRQSDQTMLGTVAARQLYAVTQAAKGYITAYAGTIEATATATTPATITVPMLVATGFLPQGFGAVNPYQQGWEVEVLQPSPGDLQALALSTGGQPIPPRDAPRIGAEAGSAGGAVTNAGTAQGAFDGWSVSLAGYTNPGVGHLASLIDYSNGQLQNDYLYRTAVPGQPQLNTMQTNLGMGGNNITNANGIQANSAALAAGTPNGQQGALQIGGSALEAGTTNMRVRTPGSLLLQNANGSAPAGIGEVNSVALGTASGTAVPGAGCSPNGVIAANANGSGQLLACQGGVWGTTSGGMTSTLNTGIAGSYSDPNTYTPNTWPGRLGQCDGINGMSSASSVVAPIYWGPYVAVTDNDITSCYSSTCGYSVEAGWTLASGGTYGWYIVPANPDAYMDAYGGTPDPNVLPCFSGVIWAQ